jgi:hypothetical protein
LNPRNPRINSKEKTMSKSSTPAAEATRFDAFTIREFEQNGEKKNDWTKIGVAFPHQDDKGFRVVLQALPVDGVIVLRLHEPKAD